VRNLKYGRNGGKVPCILNLNGWQQTALSYSQKKFLKSFYIGVWFEPQNHCGYDAREKNYCPARNRTSVVQPIADYFVE
jgi:hypothetical protein